MLRFFSRSRKQKKTKTDAPKQRKSVIERPRFPGHRSALSTAFASVEQALSRMSVRANEEYEGLLENATKSLTEDFTSGARQMADSALSNLATLMEFAAATARDRSELWSLSVLAAQQLCAARPAMSAAITSCLLRALASIKQMWDIEEQKGRKSPAELARVAGYRFEQILAERKEDGVMLGKGFVFWLKRLASEHPSTEQRMRIVTLSNSSTIRASILSTLELAPTLHLNITILESRPRCEGADMAAQLLDAAHRMQATSRLTLTIAPDCAVGSLVRDAHVVLLGADRISAAGDVSNKIGSLAAACCAKALGVGCRVVVISDGDKIVGHRAASSEVERHGPEEMSWAWHEETRRLLEKEKTEVFGEWFEWVPAHSIDAYVTEKGILDVDGVGQVGREVDELERDIFGMI